MTVFVILYHAQNVKHPLLTSQLARKKTQFFGSCWRIRDGCQVKVMRLTTSTKNNVSETQSGDILVPRLRCTHSNASEEFPPLPVTPYKSLEMDYESVAQDNIITTFHQLINRQVDSTEKWQVTVPRKLITALWKLGVKENTGLCRQWNKRNTKANEEKLFPVAENPTKNMKGKVKELCGNIVPEEKEKLLIVSRPPDQEQSSWSSP